MTKINPVNPSVQLLQRPPSDGSRAMTIFCFAVMGLLLLAALVYVIAGGRLTMTAPGPTLSAPITGQGDSSGRGVAK
jgi:hypothetical protein